MSGKPYLNDSPNLVFPGFFILKEAHSLNDTQVVFWDGLMWNFVSGRREFHADLLKKGAKFGPRVPLTEPSPRELMEGVVVACHRYRVDPVDLLENVMRDWRISQ
jgi:hypothetical protein